MLCEISLKENISLRYLPGFLSFSFSELRSKGGAMTVNNPKLRVENEKRVREKTMSQKMPDRGQREKNTSLHTRESRYSEESFPTSEHRTFLPSVWLALSFQQELATTKSTSPIPFPRKLYPALAPMFVITRRICIFVAVFLIAITYT